MNQQEQINLEASIRHKFHTGKTFTELQQEYMKYTGCKKKEAVAEVERIILAHTSGQGFNYKDM